MIEWLPEQSPALGTLEWLGDTVETYLPTGTLEDLVPAVRSQFDALLAQANAWGMKPHVRSVGRTCAQQQEQVKLGYSHADLCRSMHVLGHAVDLDLAPAACDTYTKLGVWWEGRGGVWGGRFPGFGDCGDSGHFQYGFSKAGAVPTSVCPSGVTLGQCAKIREAYLDAANAEKPGGLSHNWGLIAGAAIIGVGLAFVWSTMRVRPGALAFRENPIDPVIRRRRHAAEEEYYRVLDPVWDDYKTGKISHAEYSRIKAAVETEYRRKLKEIDDESLRGNPNPRPRSAGFVVLDTRTGEVLSQLHKKRDQAKDEIKAYYMERGCSVDSLGRINSQDIEALGLRHLGVHQVMLYPGENFDPTARRS